MDHPIRLYEDIRRRVIQLLRSSYNVRRSSNIIFVCGGNADSDMRMRFSLFCKDHLEDYEIFFPEYAMKNYFSEGIEEPFDIADFEELVGNLSHAIVIFPEAAGSFAETGYFSAVQDLAKRSILVLDTAFQAKDSFISLGPAKKIEANTLFQPVVQLNYTSPDFDVILERIRRINRGGHKQTLSFAKFSDLSNYHALCLIHEITNMLSISTFDDIVYILRGLFRSQLSVPKVRKLTSILVGSKYLREIGRFGHVTSNKKKDTLLEIRDGQKDHRDGLRLSLANIYQDYDPAFIALVELSQNAD